MGSRAQPKNVLEAWTLIPAHPLTAVPDFPALPCLPCAPASHGRQKVPGSPGESMVLGGSRGRLASPRFWEKVALSPGEVQDPGHSRSPGRMASAWLEAALLQRASPQPRCCLQAGGQAAPYPLHRQVYHLHRYQQVLVVPPSQASQAGPARQDKGVNEPLLPGCGRASSCPWCPCLNPRGPPRFPHGSQEALRAVHHHHCSNQPSHHAYGPPKPQLSPLGPGNLGLRQVQVFPESPLEIFGEKVSVKRLR